MANNPLGAYPGGFECILNFRDVGETVNGLLGKKLVVSTPKCRIEADRYALNW